MKLETISRDVSSAGIMSIHKATIAQSSKVFDFFASQTYSDKFKAIVGELVANAIDSHTEAGNTDPVDVYLPDDLDPYFRVRDRGIGMSHEFCTTRFMCYSDGSTKDDSNLVIGGFGIGSKSPFAYTDQFTLRSVHDGVCSVYSVFKDEEGIPSIGLLEQTPTDEVNGVEFSLPIEEDDFDNFREAAQTGLPYFFDKVRLHGADLDAPHFVQRGNLWAIRPRQSRAIPQVVMGGVAYPIASGQLGYTLEYDARLSPLLGMPLDLFLPIGSCSVTLSRESLLYDDKTIAAIADTLAAIIDEITADIPTMFDHLPGQWEACRALDDYLGGDQHQARSRLVLKHALYRGEELKMYFTPNPATYQKAWVINERKSGRRSGYATPDCPSPTWDENLQLVSPRNYHTVILDDLPATAKSATIKRIKTYVDEELSPKDAVLVIRPWDHEDLSGLIEGFGNIPATDYILASSLPEPERVVRDKMDKTARPRVRMFTLSDHALSKTPYTVSPCRWQSPVHEIDYENQPTEGVLVTMDSFSLPTKFWSKFRFFKLEELYFVNKSDAAKLKDFTDFEEEFERRLAAELVLNPTLAQSIALKDTCLRSLINFMQSTPELFANVPKSKPLAKLRTLVETYVVAENNKLFDYVTPELPNKLDPDALYKSIKTTHWQFMTFLQHYDYRYVSADTPEFNLMKELI